jgi:hypothetical protein
MVFYFMAVGKGTEEFLPKAPPPSSFAGRHRQFYGGFALRMTDGSSGHEQPEAQAVNGHLGFRWLRHGHHETWIYAALMMDHFRIADQKGI